MAENRNLEPYVVVVESVEEDSLQAYLVVDNRILDRVDIVDLPFVLMAAFFVYNICCSKGCSNFYTFLEIVVLKYSSEKASLSVKYLLAKINAL